MRAALVYPHQLFAANPALSEAELVVLIEEPLLWTQFNFHKHKLVLHRASMRAYAARLRDDGRRVLYVESESFRATSDITVVLEQEHVHEVAVVDPSDDWLLRRLTRSLRNAGIALTLIDNPFFLTPPTFFAEFADERKKLYFTDFYIRQRKRLGLLLDADGRPNGGRWSFDTANRKKMPRGLRPPEVFAPTPSIAVVEARAYVADRFSKAPGDAADFAYPTAPQQAEQWLADFLDRRLAHFGDYEDAMAADEATLFHSVLTPMLNVGLLTPRQVLDAALARADEVPLNALEGFVRQVVGWREYIHGVYRFLGRRQRTRNFWGHRNRLPRSFYDGTTGIEPIDTVIRRVIKHAYCHHIERLMILGNFMLLCEIDPHDVYRWFMEMFIDAYDWVMVPNVYGMSQYADGGLTTTKPYLSGSNYVLKMSNFRRGNWCAIWDALYWRFVQRHREFFAANPRLSVITKQLDRMGDKIENHVRTADQFLMQLFA
ncbi:MAG: cryptochrome/photolyase family protein [Planctomycetaceae bacterium]|nr:cryptochrome/photolyase family protein [Planctomycetaceae bacterium]